MTETMSELAEDPPASDGERGQIVVSFSLALAGLVMAVLLMQGLVAILFDRAQAQTAADAAALAGVAEDEAAARTAAKANGAELISFEMADNQVEVVVQSTDGRQARARAERRLSGPLVD